MYDINVHNMSLPDGKLGGMPYYTGFNSFVCNQRHLDAAGSSRRRPGTSCSTSAASSRRTASPSIPTSAPGSGSGRA